MSQRVASNASPQSPPPLEALDASPVHAENRQSLFPSPLTATGLSPSVTASAARAPSHTEKDASNAEERHAAVVQRLTSTVEQQRGRIRELVVSLEKKEAAAAELKRLFESLTRDYEDASRKAQSSSLALEAAQSHVAAVEEELSLAKATVAIQKEKIQHFNDEWAAKTDHLRTQFAMVVEEKTAAEAQRDELLQGHRVLRGESERLHREVEGLRQSFEARVAADVEAATASLRQAHKDREERLREREEAVQREQHRLDEGMYRVSQENTASRESKEVLQWRLAEMEKVVATKTQLHQQLTRAMEALRDEQARAERAARSERETQERHQRTLTESYQTQLAQLTHLLEQLKHEKVQSEKTAQLAYDRLVRQTEDTQERHRAALEASERREAHQREALKQVRAELAETKSKLSVSQADAHSATRLSQALADREAQAQDSEQSLRHALTAAEKRTAALQSRVEVLLHRLDEKEKETEAYRCTLERGMWVRALEWAEQAGQTLLETHPPTHLLTDVRSEGRENGVGTRGKTRAHIKEMNSSSHAPQRLRLEERPNTSSAPATPHAARTRNTLRPSGGISVLTIHKGADAGDDADDDMYEEDGHSPRDRRTTPRRNEDGTDGSESSAEDELTVFFDDALLQRCAVRESCGSHASTKKRCTRPLNGSMWSSARGLTSRARPTSIATPPRQRSAREGGGGGGGGQEVARSSGQTSPLSRLSPLHVMPTRSRAGSPFTSPSAHPPRTLRRGSDEQRHRSGGAGDRTSWSPLTRRDGQSRPGLPRAPSHPPQTLVTSPAHPLNLVTAQSPSFSAASPSALHSPWSPHVPSVASSRGGGDGRAVVEAGEAAPERQQEAVPVSSALADKAHGLPLSGSSRLDGGSHQLHPRQNPHGRVGTAETKADVEKQEAHGDPNQSLGSARYYEDDDDREHKDDDADDNASDQLSRESAGDGKVLTGKRRLRSSASSESRLQRRRRQTSRGRRGRSAYTDTKMASPMYTDPHALIRATIAAVLEQQAHTAFVAPSAPPPPLAQPYSERGRTNGADLSRHREGDRTNTSYMAAPPAGRLFISTTNTSVGSEPPPLGRQANSAATRTTGATPHTGTSPTSTPLGVKQPAAPSSHQEATPSLISGFVPPPRLSPHRDAADIGQDAPPPTRLPHHARAPSSVRSDTPLSDLLREQDAAHSEAAASQRLEAGLAAVQPAVRAWASSRQAADRYVRSTLDALVERQKRLLSSVALDEGTATASSPRATQTRAAQQPLSLSVGAGVHARATAAASSSATVLSSMDTNEANEALFSLYESASGHHVAARASTSSRRDYQRARKYSQVPDKNERTREAPLHVEKVETHATRTPPRPTTLMTHTDPTTRESGEVSPLTVDVLQKHFSQTFKLPIP